MPKPKQPKQKKRVRNVVYEEEYDSLMGRKFKDKKKFYNFYRRTYSRPNDGLMVA